MSKATANTRQNRACLRCCRKVVRKNSIRNVNPSRSRTYFLIWSSIFAQLPSIGITYVRDYLYVVVVLFFFFCWSLSNCAIRISKKGKIIRTKILSSPILYPHLVRHRIFFFFVFQHLFSSFFTGIVL